MLILTNKVVYVLRASFSQICKFCVLVTYFDFLVLLNLFHFCDRKARRSSQIFRCLSLWDVSHSLVTVNVTYSTPVSFADFQIHRKEVCRMLTSCITACTSIKPTKTHRYTQKEGVSNLQQEACIMCFSFLPCALNFEVQVKLLPYII